MARALKAVCAAAAVLLAAPPILAGSAPVAGAAPKPASAVPDGPVVVQADPFTGDAAGLAAGQIEMTTVSTRPSLVTGDEARVQVRGLSADDQLTVTVDGEDQSGAFAPVASRPGQAGGIREGLVTGLVPGANLVRAEATDAAHGTRSVTLTLTAHSIEGPVLSGPHQEPFVCQTAASGLGPPTDANCSAPAQVHWYARDLLGNFDLLADPYAAYPGDTATTEVDGRKVPFVVRVETRVINRSITHIAVLDDPHARGPSTPFAPAEWNHRLVYHFGESCGTGFHQGSESEAEVFSSLSAISSTNIAGFFMDLPSRLGQGYMVADSTLTIFGVHCNQVLSAETLMMVKEHIIDRYGDVDHVIGGGASGGAIQQYTIADQYPGLLDAGTPLLSFPDVVTTAMTVYACAVLQPVFDADPNRWTASKQIAVTGLATPSVCKDWVSLFAPDLDPGNCPAGIPASDVYDASTNPDGVRCDLSSDLKNVLGSDPGGGEPRRPVDDVGVQYGLRALQSGAITMDDFLALNASTGGFDLDDRHTQQRASMSPDLARWVYQFGFVTGRGALDETPIIDQTIPLSDLVPELDIHDQIRPFETRARLLAARGTSDSQVIWSPLPLPSNAIVVADEWLDQLDALQRAHPDLSRAQLVAEARPAAASDDCRFAVASATNLCDAGLLRHSSPRQVAGGPFSEDNVKCQLRPVRAADYPGATAAQIAQVSRVFPVGVCDFGEAPVGFTPTSLTWLSYGADGASEDPPVVVGYPLVRSAVPSASPGQTAAGGPIAGAPGAVAGGPASGTPTQRSQHTLAFTGAELRWLALAAAALLGLALAALRLRRRSLGHGGVGGPHRRR
jgi:hypothetical protein